MSHFYWKPNKGDNITLEVSSNCDEVELFQNGRSLGTKQNNRQDDKAQNKFLWEDISWQPGKVIAVARNNGKEVARHELQSPGKAVRLKAEIEDEGNWYADGMDLQFIRFTVVDSKGEPVDNFKGNLAIHIDGEAKLLALDNGNHFTDRNLESATTSLYRGGALLILRSTRNSGTVKVKASILGIKGSELLLKTK